ncbi:MAG: putative lipopolysaccharide heptosyltransferase III [Methyloprofundus sp.]|nr:putative lipopolysaccharide heptosyltransferase III [Methyloprofundus sp.]
MMQKSYLKDSVDFSTINHVLITKLQHLGDVLMITPVIATLKKKYPHLQIDVLVYAETQEILTENKDINHIFVIDRRWKKNNKTLLKQTSQLIKALKARQYQLMINYTEKWQYGALLVRLLNPKYSVSQDYAHKHGKFWRKSFTHIVKIPKTERHQVEIHLDALRRLGLYPDADNKALRIYAGHQAEQTIAQLLANHGLEKQQYIVIHPASRWMFKGWNVESFKTVIEQLSLKGHKIVAISGPDQKEVDLVEQILSGGKSTAINLAGQLPLKQLVELTTHAKCLLGLDSVAMHISAAVNTPCVVLFGPSNDINWHPWGVDHRVVTHPISCRPCNQDGCGGGKISDCLQMISADQVIQSIDNLLDANVS